MREIIIGVFRHPAAAQRALEDLCDVGFSEAHIGLLAHEEEDRATRGRSGASSPDEPRTGRTRLAPHGTMPGITGAAWPGVGTGMYVAPDDMSVMPWVLDVVTGVLPGVGRVVVGGTLESVLEAGEGGIAGGLSALGITAVEAEYYQQQFVKGRSVLVVEGHSHARLVLAILGRHGSCERTLFRLPDQEPAPFASEGPRLA